MPVTITQTCPDGHVELTYSGHHETRDDETHVRETAIPDGDRRCPVCGTDLTETVEDTDQ